MEALERYVNDCENKRRRMRDRPSDLVVSQLRWLLNHLKAASEEGDSGSDVADSDATVEGGLRPN